MIPALSFPRSDEDQQIRTASIISMDSTSAERRRSPQYSAFDSTSMLFPLLDSGDNGIAQKTIIKLADDGGLAFVREFVVSITDVGTRRTKIQPLGAKFSPCSQGLRASIASISENREGGFRHYSPWLSAADEFQDLAIILGYSSTSLFGRSAPHYIKLVNTALAAIPVIASREGVEWRVMSRPNRSERCASRHNSATPTKNFKYRAPPVANSKLLRY